jgi:hypothetical protein
MVRPTIKGVLQASKGAFAVAALPVLLLVKLLVTPFEKPVEREASWVAGLIDRFVLGRATEEEWDDFICVQIRDPRLEAIRVRCAQLPREFPASDAGVYCGPAGIEVLQAYVRDLRAVGV